MKCVPAYFDNRVYQSVSQGHWISSSSEQSSKYNHTWILLFGEILKITPSSSKISVYNNSCRKYCKCLLWFDDFHGLLDLIFSQILIIIAWRTRSSQLCGLVDMAPSHCHLSSTTEQLATLYTLAGSSFLSCLAQLTRSESNQSNPIMSLRLFRKYFLPLYLAANQQPAAGIDDHQQGINTHQVIRKSIARKPPPRDTGTISLFPWTAAWLTNLPTNHPSKYRLEEWNLGQINNTW